MEPTIKKEHFVWISNYEKNKNPVRGDIIIFFPVREEKEKYLKRVIGLPNETVIIKEGTVYLKNKENSKRKKLDEPYLAPKTVTEPNGEFQVPGGQYFILGDNRGHSDDSRRFGCIPRKDIIGKVTKIF